MFGVPGVALPRPPARDRGLPLADALPRQQRGSPADRDSAESLLIKNVSFDAIPGGERVIATGGTSSQATSQNVQEDEYRFYSPEAILKWHQSCLDLEPKLVAFGPVHSRDPAAWLCFLAARRQVGRHNDAITFIRDYFKNTPDAAAMSPGTDAWRDCLAAELWMTDRNLVPTAAEAARRSASTRRCDRCSTASSTMRAGAT